MYAVYDSRIAKRCFTVGVTACGGRGHSTQCSAVGLGGGSVLQRLEVLMASACGALGTVELVSGSPHQEGARTTVGWPCRQLRGTEGCSGKYVMVMGVVQACSPEPCLQAVKMTDLSENPLHESMWALEVEDLHRSIP
ncbi:RecQ mediated genome instability 2 [Ictidomys tridecemlineatus]|uniref:recQ-mediated genome instability protein 2 n=1 Tax=Ictidomys tridecemlineatus TaxID=43179 RepID=UPI000B541A71|nr:recQ-mediated genome instability protein 2 [Ictidomys tridecemlineatus]KAG3259233.1 RecQ mediated genome instability 2 [Ictidomys tridecemlineatus]